MDPLHIAAGALTGFVVGSTGVGGGALMTPILLLVFGVAPMTAVGTDLWFAALTKCTVSALHIRAQLIEWSIVRWLAAGSLPGALVTVAWMAQHPAAPGALTLIRTAIAVMVSLTAVSLLAGGYTRGRLTAAEAGPRSPGMTRALTIAAGAGLGTLVALTSVGAGALGAVCLYRLYPGRLTPLRLVATDIAHAIPLALCAGIGHLATGQVDLALLRDLLAGSVPAALLGASVSARAPQAWLSRALGLVLLVIGATLLLNP
jgi:uncharacterized protein